MQEFLILYHLHFEPSWLNEYTEKADRYFRTFDLHCTYTPYLRENWGLIWCHDEQQQTNIYDDAQTGSLLACLGTWFFREQPNDRATNTAHLFLQFQNNTQQALSGVEGAYNFIWYDARRKLLQVVTDRIGVTPIYTRQIGETTLISSNCLLLASLQPVELDPVGLQEFLLANKLFGSTTLFQGITKLSPASIYEYHQTTHTTTTYWSAHCGESSTLSTSEKVSQFAAALHTNMKRLGEVFTHPCVDLTGGWDSRTAIMTIPHAISRFATSTAGNPNDDDVVIAQMVAQHLGVPHYVNPPVLEADPFDMDAYLKALHECLFLTDGLMSAPLYVNTFANHQKNRERGADLTLNGSGGELYRAYWWDPAQLYYSNFKAFQFTIPGMTTYYNTHELARRVMHQTSELSVFRPDFDTNITGHLIALFEATNAPYMPISNVAQIANVYIAHRMGNWLAGYSKATSRFLPCLSPLLMSTPLEIAVQLNSREKAGCRFLRQFHAAVNPELARITTCYGYPTLPLSFGNVPQFLPALQKEMTTVSRKVLQKAGLASHKAGNSWPRKNAAAIRRMLNVQPERMKLSGIFDTPRLTAFLKQAQQESFAYTDFYNNIYTVEAILQIV